MYAGYKLTMKVSGRDLELTLRNGAFEKLPLSSLGFLEIQGVM